MPTRIRLQRKGKKGQPYYHIVVADTRAPRDGKYIERLGAYDPGHKPAFIEINFDKTIDWLQKGAQPSDTCKAILSYKGVVYKNHLLNGVKKGAFDAAEADRRFDTWLNEKNTKIEAQRKSTGDMAEAAVKNRVAEETKKSQDQAAKLSAKRAEAFAEAKPAEAPAADASADVPAEAPAPEAPAAE